MKLEDHSVVTELVEMRKKLISALGGCVKFDEKRIGHMNQSRLADDALGDIKSGGYYANLSEHSDGSGGNINLEGCYCAREMVAATREVIRNQMLVIDKRLEQYGIVTPEDDGTDPPSV